MRFIDIIRKKRDGLELSQLEVQAFVDSVTAGSTPDYQLSALLMAIFINGMSARERGWLTQAMTRSGDVLDFSHISQKKVDKHSTGGVGDKVSLCLAPAVAAAGVVVPMVSGRGLGHTGGTLDKLESIPGLVTRLSTERFKEIVEICGLCLAGQSADIAPADKRMYALRDVTSTVESLPLIAGSIMSKKLAEGLDGLVLDVKVGSGAFMKTLDDARELAETLVDIGKRCGLQVTAFLTDMDQPLGRAIGNANEMEEAIDVLRGGGPSDLVEITEVLGGEMCVLGGVASDLADGKAKIRAAIDDGSALAQLRRVIELQEGNPDVCDDSSLFPKARYRQAITAGGAGYVAGFETEELGRIVIGLGGGRNVASDEVDPAVGITIEKKRGERVDEGDVLAVVEANDVSRLDAALKRIGGAIRISGDAPSNLPLIHEVIR